MSQLGTRCQAVITGVVEASIAEELGVKPGDMLLTINGKRITDQISYRFFQAEESLELEIKKSNGELWILEVEKEFDEDLGLIFEQPTFDGIKKCCNKCLFCFVDQMPANLRNSLYVKDDDYRYSFLYGNYITLTNLSAAEFKKIIELKLSPLYVSIHTTNPQLREKMLQNRKAGKIMDQLKLLIDHGITVHGQMVLVPGLNDGAELDRSLEDLASLLPGIGSLAVVPVGLTKFRSGPGQVKQFNSSQAQRVLATVNYYQKKFLNSVKTRLIYAADEFFTIAGAEIPAANYYEDYPQLENGVGLVRLLLDDFHALKNRLPAKTAITTPIFVITGVSAYLYLQKILTEINGIMQGLNVTLIAVENLFFGSSVTVAGLLTGQDILKSLQQLSIPAQARIVIPDVMLKEGEYFLDNMTITQLQSKLGSKLEIAETSAAGLLRAITGYNF